MRHSVSADAGPVRPLGATLAAIGVFLPCWLFVVIPATYFRREHHDAAREEQPRDLRLGPRRHQRAREEDRPRDAVAADGRDHELPRAPPDDGDHRGADAVEGALHPREPAVREVDRGQRQHHHERRQHERRRDQRRSERPGLQPAEPDRKLRRERPRRELGEREPFDVVALREPAALLDEVALHVADERDRAPEAEGSQAQEVAEQLGEGEGS
jgi:hypothetical protein